MIGDLNFPVPVSVPLQAFVHLSALIAKATHVTSLCTLSRWCCGQLVSP